MVVWLHRTTRAVESTSPRGMELIHPADAPFVDAGGGAVSNSNWLYRPDVSAVTGFPRRYWKITGSRVELMRRDERDSVDAAEKGARVREARRTAKEGLRQDRAKMAFLRVIAPKVGMTRAELLAAIDADVDAN